LPGSPEAAIKPVAAGAPAEELAESSEDDDLGAELWLLVEPLARDAGGALGAS